MRNPRIADILRDRAKKNATKTDTGTAGFDRVTVAYYPVSERCTWFLDGEPVSKKEAVDWLVRPAQEKTIDDTIPGRLAKYG